ncbi:MAG: cyanophycin synthetase [Caldicoprobacterales bacterium]|nr:cyanophycin synthetase [Clostridiales bacterium]
MKIIEIKAYKGRNVYSHRKTIKMVVDLGVWIDTPTKDIKNFNEKLLNILPGLYEHKCSMGYPGGFVERLNKGTYMAHVIEHIALELLYIMGENVSFGKAIRVGDSSLYTIVFEYIDETRGLEVGKVAVQLVKSLCNHQTFNLNSALEIVKKKVCKNQLGPSTKAIVDAAERRKIPIIKIGKDSIIQLGYGKYQKRIQATIVENTSCIAVDIACDKTTTKLLLDEVGIPVPEGGVCKTLQQALSMAEKIGYPVVIKPERGNQGKGVSLDVNSPSEVADAFITASAFDSNILVEKCIKGNDYRVLVINGRVAAVAKRIPAHVVGDGVHNITELVEITNKDPKRGEDHEKPLTKIKIDDISLRVLLKQGYKVEDVPPKGKKVFLKQNGNISTGGQAIDCTDIIHPENANIAVRASQIIGLDIAGVDITCPDISKPISVNGGAVIEVNAAPGLRMHLFPSKGKPRKVADMIIDMLFPATRRHSVPIISITGTNGKTTTARMISHILNVYGMNVGMAVTGGIYINDKCLIKGDTTGPISARTVLMDKSIDVAVLETARGGIIRSGLAYDLCDIGILTNLSEDHLGIDEVYTLEDLLHIKSLVIESIKPNGYAVLNADDPMVVQAAKRVNSNIIYFSKQEDNIIVHKHILSGGKAVFIRNKYVTIATGNGNIQSLHISKIPAVYGGKLIHNIENCLAAISAAYSMMVPIPIIEKAMTSFYSDEWQNPGRFNIFNIKNFRVIVDYGHNIASYKLMGEAIKKMGASRLIGIIGVPGDRDNSTIKAIGHIAATIFDKVIIKEDTDLRNRKKGEVAKLLEEGVLSQGMRKDDIEIILSETQALDKAIGQASAGDLIVIFYEKLEPVLDVIKKALVHTDYKFEKELDKVLYSKN